MNKFGSCLLAAAVVLAGCGGSSSDEGPTNPEGPTPPTGPKPPTGPAPESFDKITTATTVGVLSLDSSKAMDKAATISYGTWLPDEKKLRAADKTEIALRAGSEINPNYAAIRELSGGANGERFAFLETETLPSGTKEYSTSASLAISESSTASIGYQLEGLGKTSVDFESGIVAFEFDLLGNKTTNTGTKPIVEPVVNGILSVENLKIQDQRILGTEVTRIAITGLDQVAFGSDTEMAAIGAFTGPNAEEFGLVLQSKDSNTLLEATVAGQEE